MTNPVIGYRRECRGAVVKSSKWKYPDGHASPQTSGIACIHISHHEFPKRGQIFVHLLRTICRPARPSPVEFALTLLYHVPASMSPQRECEFIAGHKGGTDISVCAKTYPLSGGVPLATPVHFLFDVLCLTSSEHTDKTSDTRVSAQTEMSVPSGRILQSNAHVQAVIQH